MTMTGVEFDDFAGLLEKARAALSEAWLFIDEYDGYMPASEYAHSAAMSAIDAIECAEREYHRLARDFPEAVGV